MGFKEAAKAIGGVLTGGFVTEAMNIVNKVLPDKMSDKEKAEIEIQMIKLANEKELGLLDKWNEAQREFQDFVSQHEGTATDLKQLGWLGRLLLGVRGMQRPIWGFGTLFMDFKVLNAFMMEGSVFSSAGQSGTLMMYMILSVNIIVLSFLFGERAIQNVLPLVERAIRAYTGNEKDFPKKQAA